MLAIGLARYDSDRGGAQEDDRTGQYREVAQEIIGYTDSHGMQHIKVIYVMKQSELPYIGSSLVLSAWATL